MIPSSISPAMMVMVVCIFSYYVVVPLLHYAYVRRPGIGELDDGCLYEGVMKDSAQSIEGHSIR